MTNVFVYGTLRDGGRLHRYMQGATFVGKARVEGELFSLGSFPGAEFGSSQTWVEGEIYRVTPEILSRLDDLEGFHPDRTELSMYVRRKVTPVLVLGKGRTVPGKDVWAYEYRTRGPKDRRPTIKHGDWLMYLAEKGID